MVSLHFRIFKLLFSFCVCVLYTVASSNSLLPTRTHITKGPLGFKNTATQQNLKNFRCIRFHFFLFEVAGALSNGQMQTERASSFEREKKKFQSWSKLDSRFERIGTNFLHTLCNTQSESFLLQQNEQKIRMQKTAAAKLGLSRYTIRKFGTLLRLWDPHTRLAWFQSTDSR